MVSNFEFLTANRIIFGPGTINQVGSLIAAFGKKVLLVTRTDDESTDRIIGLLEHEGCKIFRISITGEPTLSGVLSGVEMARKNDCDVVLAIGGGSVIDFGKAIAALVTNTNDIFYYLEVVGQSQPLTSLPLPFIACPTTAGTGSEVTKNAVILVEDEKVKVSLRSPMMLPRIALIDPELTLSMPAKVTAATGMDALVQVIEPFVSKKANLFVDEFCRAGMRHISSSIQTAFHEPAHIEARAGMSFGSLMGGLALANGGLGAVHGLAAPLGGMFHCPHGAVCAILLPYVIEKNWHKNQKSSDPSAYVSRYKEVAEIITSKQDASVEYLIQFSKKLVDEFQIPWLHEYGVKTENLKSIAEKSLSSSSMKGNPITLTTEDIIEILENAL